MLLRRTALLTILLLAWGCALPPISGDAKPGAAPTPPTVRGPVPHRSQHPIFMTFLDFEQRRAATAPAGEAELDASIVYTSMFQRQFEGTAGFEFDGEWARAEITARVGITHRLEAFATVPYLYTTSGFLDAFVENWHDVLSLPQAGRDDFKRDKWAGRLTENGKTIFTLKEDTAGFGDIPVGLAFAALREDESTPGLLVRGAIELPTGDEDDGFGNGGLDAGLGIVAEKSLGCLTLTAGLDYAFIRRPESMKGSGVEVDDLIGAFLSAEARLLPSMSCLVAVDFLSQPLDDINLDETRRDQWMLIIGGAVDLGDRSTFRFDVTEDLQSDGAPDFSLRAGLNLRF